MKIIRQFLKFYTRSRIIFLNGFIHRNNIRIGEDVILGNPIFIKGNISIGSGTYINSYSHIKTGSKSKVEIGKYCEISYNVHIWAITHNNEFPTGPNRKLIEKDIVIGDNVWIGANVFIKEGIQIGSNSIIGANSVVTKDVMDNTIVAGSPARIIKSRSNLL